jgi:hypothetical protein
MKLPIVVVRSSLRRVALACASVLLFAPVAFAQQPGGAPEGRPAKPPRELTAEEKKAIEAKRAQRVYVQDLAGLWVAQDWAAALKATRAPHAAAAKVTPLVVNIQKEGRSWPILRTDFDRAVLYRVIDIQPDGSGQPGRLRIVVAERDDGPVSASDAVNIPIRATKNFEGKVERLQVADPLFSKKKLRDFERVATGLGLFVNTAVIAGRYTDADGRAWEFSPDGQAKLPDGASEYEVSLVGLGAKCEYLELPDDKAPGGKRRIGFAWKGPTTLHLFAASGTKPQNIRCDPKPVAVLERAS